MNTAPPKPDSAQAEADMQNGIALAEHVLNLDGDRLHVLLGLLDTDELRRAFVAYIGVTGMPERHRVAAIRRQYPRTPDREDS
ncbi:hypothetical protein [Tsukamurella sp. NPDC003166]|uniref:hypothetical protein n=1 Tax=Tsukamurella sp. NPDC003166 TaxID=3154444 RepID=UPI0033A537F2